MKQKLYRTTKPVRTLNLTIPENSFVVLKYSPEHADGEFAIYEFLGLFSGLTKILYREEVVFDSFSDITY